MSVLTLVRHGQAAYMEADYDKLSPLGEVQARKLGEFWVKHAICFDRVLHGPAKRHIRTMEIASQVVRGAGLPCPDPEPTPALDEFDAFAVMRRMVPVLVNHDENVRSLWSRFQENRESPEAGRILQKLFEDVARHWCSGDFDTPDVESYAQFRLRIERAVDTIRETTTPSSSVVAFTSAGPIAMAVAHVLDLSPRRAIEFVWMSRNSSYSQFLFSGKRFSLHAFNAIPHLDDLPLLTYR